MSKSKAPPPPPPITAGTPIVLDLGTSITRIGITGETLPRTIFPTVVARPRNGKRPVYVGSDAISARGNFGFFYPVERGVIKDWKEVEQVFFHSFYSLRIASREHPVLMSEPLNSPKKDREKITQYMFEEFNVPYFRLMNSATLTLAGAGKNSGVAIESGHYQTQIVPISEGSVLTSQIQTLNWGGWDLTNFLVKLTGKSDFPAVKDLKEKLCYVALNYGEEKTTFKSKSLPRDSDGKTPQLGEDAIKVPEVFFQPDLIDQKHDALPLCILNTIQKCDTKIQQGLLEGLILSGGNTMFPNFVTRLTQELKHYLSTSKFSSLASLNPTFASSPSISAPPNRVHASWIGGASIKAEDSDRSKLWMSRAEYEETGASLVHRKCP